MTTEIYSVEVYSVLTGAVLMLLVVVASLLLRPWRILYSRAQSRELAEAVKTVAEASAGYEQVQGATERLERLLATERRRADDYLATIDKVIAEREEWRGMYFTQAREHGNAQDMLLRERDVNARRMAAAGLKPHVDQRVDALVRAYHDEHVAPHVVDEAARLVAEKAQATIEEATA